MNFQSGIHVLVKKDDKYLVIRRHDDDPDDPGCWDFPGGGINWGEQPLDAAIRETKEEAGIDIKMTKILGTWALPAGENWSIEFITEGEYLSGEVKISEEHTGYRWIMYEELKNIEPKSLHIKALLEKSLGVEA